MQSRTAGVGALRDGAACARTSAKSRRASSSLLRSALMSSASTLNTRSMTATIGSLCCYLIASQPVDACYGRNHEARHVLSRFADAHAALFRDLSRSCR